MNKITRLLFVGYGLWAMGTAVAAEPPRPEAREPQERHPNDVRGARSALIGPKKMEGNPFKAMPSASLHTQTQHWTPNQHFQNSTKNSFASWRGASKLGQTNNRSNTAFGWLQSRKSAEAPKVNHGQNERLVALGGPAAPGAKTTAFIGGESTPQQRARR